jgi:hypothetical protein
MNPFRWRWCIILAVWLTVLAIPTLRHVAQSPLPISVWPLSQIFHRPEKINAEHHLAARYPGDARLWAQAAESDYIRLLPYSANGYDAPTMVPESAPSPLFPGKPDENYQAERRRRYDILIEKFPRETWLLAHRLRWSWGYMYGDRVGGELSDPNLTANQADGKPSPERRISNSSDAPPGAIGTSPLGSPTAFPKPDYPNFKPQELGHVIALCRRGQKLEPNNAFYDWTLSYFLALSWRDKEAWAALDSAARKTGWDDHRLQEIQAQLAAREVLLGRPLLWEEKAMLWANTLFPDFAREREYARIVSWQSIKAQRRGDHAQALWLRGNFAKTCANMRDHSHFIIERLVAVAMENIALAGATYDARQRNPAMVAAWRSASTNDRIKITFDRFRSHAVAHGRKDLAAWAARDRGRVIACYAPVKESGIAGTPSYVAAFIVVLWLIGVLLMATLPYCLLTWLLLSWFGQSTRLRRVLWWSAPRDEMTRRDKIMGTLSCSGLPFFGFVFRAALLCGVSFVLGAMLIGQGGALWGGVADWWNDLFAAPPPNAIDSHGLWSDFVFSMLGANLRQLDHDYWPWALSLLPVIFGALWCAGRAVEKQDEWRREADEYSGVHWPPPFHFKNFLTALTTGNYFHHNNPHSDAAHHEISWPEFNFNLGAIALTFARGLGYAAFGAAWLATAVSDDVTSRLIAAAIAFVLSLILWLDLYLRWHVSKGEVSHRRRAVRWGLRLLRESWLNWLVLGSLLFLLSLLLAAPLRFQANRAVDRYLRLGEIATLK